MALSVVADGQFLVYTGQSSASPFYFMNRIFSMLALFSGLGVCLISCDQENPTLPTTFIANINGTSVKPTPTPSSATGGMVGVLNETTRVLSYTVAYTGTFSSSLTTGAIHRITPNATTATGPAEITFDNLTSPISGTYVLPSQARLDSLKGGFFYVDLSTKSYPLGEVRGNIKQN